MRKNTHANFSTMSPNQKTQRNPTYYMETNSMRRLMLRLIFIALESVNNRALFLSVGVFLRREHLDGFLYNESKPIYLKSS